jgi:hypothetical protein
VQPPIGALRRAFLEGALGLPAIEDLWRGCALIDRHDRPGRENEQNAERGSLEKIRHDARSHAAGRIQPHYEQSTPLRRKKVRRGSWSLLSLAKNYVTVLAPSFRDSPMDQTRNLEIPGSALRAAPE